MNAGLTMKGWRDFERVKAHASIPQKQRMKEILERELEEQKQIRARGKKLYEEYKRRTS